MRKSSPGGCCGTRPRTHGSDLRRSRKRFRYRDGGNYRACLMMARSIVPIRGRLLVTAPRQLAISDLAQSNPALRSEESLQDGDDAPPVLVGVTEELSREEDVVRVELPELLSGDGDLGDP